MPPGLYLSSLRRIFLFHLFNRVRRDMGSGRFIHLHLPDMDRPSPTSTSYFGGARRRFQKARPCVVPSKREKIGLSGR